MKTVTVRGQLEDNPPPGREDLRVQEKGPPLQHFLFRPQTDRRESMRKGEIALLFPVVVHLMDGWPRGHLNGSSRKNYYCIFWKADMIIISCRYSAT